MHKVNETLEQRVAERTKLAKSRAVQLQALAMELINAEEKERARIADLLHEDLQQILVSARMQLSAVSKSLPSEPILANVDHMLEKSVGKMRRLSHELSPVVLHHLGLVASIEWLIQQMKEQFGLSIEFASEIPRQPERSPIEVFMFRAAKELLFNIVKHAASVDSIQVALSSDERNFILKVSDQGRGFNPDILDSSPPTIGFGLLGLRERADYLGGSLSIESSPGKGSSLTIKVPYELSQA